MENKEQELNQLANIDMEIDDFIHTLQLIFEKRIIICTDCNICRIYKTGKNSIHSILN